MTAPSDGTLVVQLIWDPSLTFIYMQIEDVAFSYWPPSVGTLPVTAGRTYRVTVYSGLGPWDYGGDTPFALTTSMLDPGAVIPSGCRMAPPVLTWVGVNGDWVPPDHPLAFPGGSAPTPSSPSPPGGANPCVTTQPVPVGHPLAGGGG